MGEQLKCKKTDVPHRDPDSGSWCAYVPVGGALNISKPSEPDAAEPAVHAHHPALIPVDVLG